MAHNIYIYIFIMAAVSYAIRVVPLTLIRTEITNPFLSSFLYYVPYVTLAVMTFPAIMTVTSMPAFGLAALIIGVVLSWKGASLFQVAVACCGTVLLLELLVTYVHI